MKILEVYILTFVYFSLNDNREKWKTTLEYYGLVNNQNFLIENGNTSIVIEELGIRTIPHYLIYNPEGELINGRAKRPGQGVNKELRKLMDN